jgi:hypothetical protein
MTTTSRQRIDTAAGLALRPPGTNHDSGRQCTRHGGRQPNVGSTGGISTMMASWVPAQMSCGPDSGRILDTARGILIGLRRCRPENAFDELHSAARRHRVPVYAMAWALVHLAGEGGTSHDFADAQSAARREWGQLFGRSFASRC